MRTLRPGLLFLLLLALPAFSATYVVPADRELVSLSRTIVSGSVIDSHARRSATGRIETVTTVAVEEWLKGSRDARTVDIVLPGGELDGVRMTFTGAPSFSTGDRVLLFLSTNGRGDW